MDTKLTLKLDKEVIENAKKYAASHKKSLSRMIESYLRALMDKEPVETHDDIAISPFVKSMKTGVKIPADLDIKKEYGDYLRKKYK